MPIRKPTTPYHPVVFAKWEDIIRNPGYVVMTPGVVEDAKPSDDPEKVGAGYNRLYFLVNLKDHELYTNVLTNDQGEVCSTNYTEKYTNFTVGDNGEVHLQTKMHVDATKGIAVPWYKR